MEFFALLLRLVLALASRFRWWYLTSLKVGYPDFCKIQKVRGYSPLMRSRLTEQVEKTFSAFWIRVFSRTVYFSNCFLLSTIHITYFVLPNTTATSVCWDFHPNSIHNFPKDMLVYGTVLQYQRPWILRFLSVDQNSFAPVRVHWVDPKCISFRTYKCCLFDVANMTLHTPSTLP